MPFGAVVRKENAGPLAATFEDGLAATVPFEAVVCKGRTRPATGVIFEDGPLEATMPLELVVRKGKSVLGCAEPDLGSWISRPPRLE